MKVGDELTLRVVVSGVHYETPTDYHIWGTARDVKPMPEPTALDLLVRQVEWDGGKSTRVPAWAQVVTVRFDG